MSVYRDQLGERSNNLINELLAKGLGLAFYKGKCLEMQKMFMSLSNI